MKALISLVLLVILSGCQMTVEKDVGLHNQNIVSNLTPIQDFYKGSFLQNCENNVVSLENYQEVYENKESGVYQNELTDYCIVLSFQEESEAFYQEVLESAFENTLGLELNTLFQRMGFSQSVEGIFINNFNVEGYLVQAMRYGDQELVGELSGLWSKRKVLLPLLEEFIFIHELFHTTEINLDNSLPKNIREGLADVSAVWVLSHSYEMDKEETLSLLKDVYNARKKEASLNPHGVAYEGSHLRMDIFELAIDHIESQNENFELRFNNLNEVDDYVLNLIIPNITIKREAYATGEVYWELGARLP